MHELILEWLILLALVYLPLLLGWPALLKRYVFHGSSTDKEAQHVRHPNVVVVVEWLPSVLAITVLALTINVVYPILWAAALATYLAAIADLFSESPYHEPEPVLL